MSEKHVRKYDFGAMNLIDFGSISEPFQYEKSTAKQCEKNTAKTTKYYELIHVKTFPDLGFSDKCVLEKQLFSEKGKTTQTTIFMQ